MNSDELFIDGNKLPQPLEKDEFYKLIQEASVGSKQARDKLIIYNIRLVLYEVTNKFQNVDYEKKDLVSIGNIGLVKAIDNYDISKGFEFTSYAAKCIDNEILMFLKKLKKDQNVDSIDRVVFYDNDGSKLKLEDILSDNSDLARDYEKSETQKIIRDLVEKLPDRDKEIIMLYFGFYNDRIYTQKEIAEKFHVSRQYVASLITKIVKKLGNQLETVGVIEFHTNLNEKGNKETRRLKSIYEYFKNYTRVQIDEMLAKLTKEERELITLRYGADLDNPVSEKLTKEDTYIFYSLLVPKMKRLLANSNGECKKRCNKLKEDSTPVVKTDKTGNDINKDDCIKMLELLKTPTITQMMKLLTLKESVIISLKLGYIDGKCFSTESIAQFLGVEETEVIEITKKALLLFKENMNGLLDSNVEVATDQVAQGKVLAMKPIKN